MDLPPEIKTLAEPPGSLGLPKLDELLNTLQPIVLVAAQLDQRYPTHWHHLKHLIPEVRNQLWVRYQEASLWVADPPYLRKKIKVGDYPIYTSLTSRAAPQAGNRTLPLKALLLAGRHSNSKFFWEKSTSDRFQSLFNSDYLKDVADKLRLCSNANWQHFHLLLENVPEWTGESVEAWKEAFQCNVSQLPGFKWRSPYPRKHDYLFLLSRVLDHVTSPLTSNTNTNTPPACPESTAADVEPGINSIVRSLTAESQLNPITGHEIRTRPNFHSYSRQHPTSEEIAEATAPEIRSVFPQESIGTDDPEKAHAVAALEVRYTNYRTSMDNQRLPWAWDCCNPLEIRSLVRSLVVVSPLADQDHSQGVLLVWLTLLTGQPLEEILDFALNDHAAQDDCNSLIQGRYWRRHIPYPRQAYAPKPHHVEHLYANMSKIDFELPEPVIQLTATLGLQQVSASNGRNVVRLGKFLNIDPKTANALVH